MGFPTRSDSPGSLLCPPLVSQESGTKEKVVLLVLIHLTTWHHSFRTGAVLGLRGHRSLSAQECQGLEAPLMALAADACAGPSYGGWRSRLDLCLSLNRCVYGCLACGSCVSREL